jgi:hypothetical protein
LEKLLGGLFKQMESPPFKTLKFEYIKPTFLNPSNSKGLEISLPEATNFSLKFLPPGIRKLRPQ